ncbi:MULTISPECIES: 2,3-diphosphoglycerate-dependent phosphoglycerate mutase [Acidianus]|uniref:Phosphoglycerate mutase n=1 Tax=Candidatus Acidianus copahuensis TaxID=1160895 RepID=A0A031LJY7_9CREN|nr:MULTISPECIES: 2,3-diphosphoglycerate-dependent phosphoglycerate mutase [Acidianus]EZQ01831.1 phosphoglycerate mutase [Candidatus Acidianus copahuensis]NON63601.1 histidine phosphatase family protein [Acidianus sp. RZ1]
MALILLIRHGHSTSNQNRVLSHDNNTYPLTEEGQNQAKKVAKELERVKVSKIYTSPILRAYQTASIIGNHLGIVPIVDERLRERFLGELNNTRFDPSDHWKIKLIRGQIEVRGLEPWEVMQKRMIEFVNSISGKDDGAIVAVSHYDPIRSIIGYILGLDDISAYGISLPNASITSLEIKEGNFKIHSIGSPILSKDALQRLYRYVEIANR